jgi:protein-tyrosine kinase
MFEEGPSIAPFSAERAAQAVQYDELLKRCAHPVWHINAQLSAFHSAVENRIGAERFRTLRGRLYQIAELQPLKRVLITSSIPAEGKTFVASNLAQSIIMQPERRVLLIDADLRLPKLHLALGAPQSPGLTDYLRGDADDCSIIQHGSEKELCFIPSGTDVSNPSELLMNGRFKGLLDKFSPLFDWVIIDSPPALAVHDASMIAAHADGVLFVVRQGTTHYEVAVKATEGFKDKNLLGAILNDATPDGSHAQYYYNYGDGYRGPEKN